MANTDLGINFEVVTLEDAIDLFEKKNIVCVINDGKLIDLVNEE